jgi:hypothetical protein
MQSTDKFVHVHDSKSGVEWKYSSIHSLPLHYKMVTGLPHPGCLRLRIELLFALHMWLGFSQAPSGRSEEEIIN